MVEGCSLVCRPDVDGEGRAVPTFYQPDGAGKRGRGLRGFARRETFSARDKPTRGKGGEGKKFPFQRKSLDYSRRRKKSYMVFARDPSQRSPGVISGNNGKLKSGWPDRESDPGPPECVSTSLAAEWVGQELIRGHGAWRGCRSPLIPLLHPLQETTFRPPDTRLLCAKHSYFMTYQLKSRKRGGVVVRLLASHLGEPGSIPSGVALGSSHVGIVPSDTAGRRVFSEISYFLSHSSAPSFSLYTTMLRATQNSLRSSTLQHKNTRLLKCNTISAYTRQKEKSKYINRIRLERACQKQSSDAHKTPYDRVNRKMAATRRHLGEVSVVRYPAAQKVPPLAPPFPDSDNKTGGGKADREIKASQGRGYCISLSPAADKGVRITDTPGNQPRNLKPRSRWFARASCPQLQPPQSPSRTPITYKWRSPAPGEVINGEVFMRGDPAFAIRPADSPIPAVSRKRPGSSL
ncbi:hypothetical protein PR048_014335 [Dryococelus australis]|uniref:Uncharacterized protein n=1 Tax=Dryococelus australis TaxID=614101 RepID=A0ABQ9HE10_9NEOP|nr:hypothetical protein PR048_014335 [Dryococelus australis]